MRIKSVSAVAAALAAMVAAGAAFPVNAVVKNDGYSPMVEPETSTSVAPYGESAVTFNDADQLVRALGNIEQLNELTGAHPDAGMSIVLPFGEDAKPVDADAAAAQAAADEAARVAAANAEAERLAAEKKAAEDQAAADAAAAQAAASVEQATGAAPAGGATKAKK